MNGNTRTHKNEDAISIAFPSLGILVVLFLCGFGVYGEEGSRAVTEIGFNLRWLIRCWLRNLRLIAFYLYVCETGRGHVNATGKTHLDCSPFLDLGE
jgi:hypothetical protein